MAIEDDIRNALRDYKTVTATYPLGDPSSPVWNPPKKTLRDALVPLGAEADALSASVVDAETSRAQAELAAIAAGATLYDSTADGLAGTVSGDVFLVSTEPGVQVYRNDTTATFLGWLGRVEFDTFGSFIASNTTFISGTLVTVRDIQATYRAVAGTGTGNLGQANAGGQEFDVLPGKAGYDVRAFPGGNAGEKIAKAIDALLGTGGVVNATGLTGTQTFGSDIFASRSKPFVLRLGKATFETTVSSYTLSLGSHQHIVLEGTTLQPDAVGEASSARGGLISTKITETTGSITAGSNELTLASTDGVQVGCLVAIDGSGGGVVFTETTLSSAIDATTTTIPLTDASDFPSTYTIVIGSEIITGSTKSGNSLTNVTRGAYGSTAASHTSGTTVQFSPYQRAFIESISGSVATLSGNATVSVNSAQILIGSTGASVTGFGIFDGRQDRNAADPAKNLYGMNLKLATKCVVGNDLTFKNWDHGGVYLESAWFNDIGGRFIGNSRPADGLGANIWIFRQSSFNNVHPSEMTDSYNGIFIDDRTTTANLTDGPCNKNNLILPNISCVNKGIEISGSNKNTVYAAGVQGAVAITISTNDQGSTLRSANDNTIITGHVEGSTAAVVLRDSDNYVEIGSTDDLVDNGGSTASFSTVVVKEGASAGHYFGSGITAPRKEYRATKGASIRITSTATQIASGDTIGAIEFYGSDTSGPGAGVKAGIRAEATGGTGDSSRLFFTVANGVDGNGFDAAEFNQVGWFLPLKSGTQLLGGPSNLWDTVYASTGTINTSDAREKQDIAFLTEAETRVALRLKGLVRTYRWRKSVSEKGDAARKHIGWIAQEVEAAFDAEGLNGFDYGCLCYDEWDAEVGADGQVAREAGNRYSIRTDQILAFVVSAA